MPTRSLNIQTSKNRPFLTVSLEGYLAQLEVYKLKSKIEEQIQDGCRFVILDLTDVKYIDSAGIGSICHIHNKCNEVNGLAMIVANPRSNIVQTLKLAGTDHIVSRFETEQLARNEIQLRFGLTPNNMQDNTSGVPAAGTVPGGSPTQTDTPSRMEAILAANQNSTTQIIQLLETLIDQIANLDRRIEEIDRKVSSRKSIEVEAS